MRQEKYGTADTDFEVRAVYSGLISLLCGRLIFQCVIISALYLFKSLNEMMGYNSASTQKTGLQDLL